MNTPKLNKKMAAKTTHYEKKAGRLARRFAFIAVLIGVVGAVHVSNIALAWLQTKEIRPIYVADKKDMSITIQMPIRNKTAEDSKFHSPIPVVQAEDTKKVAVPSPTPTSGKLSQEVLEKMYYTTWTHESGRGKDLRGLNGDCIELGMINEIGYAPGQGFCFKDRVEQKETYMLWANNRYGKDCVKTGFCRETVGELLSLYSNDAYNTLLK